MRMGLERARILMAASAEVERLRALKWERWLHEVNVELIRRADVVYSDLEDFAWRDWFLDGVSAKAAAGRALKDAALEWAL